MNQIVFVGRICRDIEIKSAGENSKVVNNALAIPRTYRDRNGETITDFIPFVAWNGLATMLHKFACKGQRIAISGMMQSRKYQDKDNKPVYVIECHAQEIELLDRPSAKSKEDQSFKSGGSEPDDETQESMQIAREMVDQVIDQLKEESTL